MSEREPLLLAKGAAGLYDGGTLLAGTGDAGGTLGFAVTSREGFSDRSLRSCQSSLRPWCCSAVSPQGRFSPRIGRELGFAGEGG